MSFSLRTCPQYNCCALLPIHLRRYVSFGKHCAAFRCRPWRIARHLQELDNNTYFLADESDVVGYWQCDPDDEPGSYPHNNYDLDIWMDMRNQGGHRPQCHRSNDEDYTDISLCHGLSKHGHGFWLRKIDHDTARRNNERMFFCMERPFQE